MRQALGFMLSLLIHGGLVVPALIAFPQARRTYEDLVVVPVELVTLAADTNVRSVQPEPKISPEDLASRTVPQPRLAPRPKPEPEIVSPSPKPEPAPDTLPDPAPETEPENIRLKPEPEPQGLDLEALSALVDRSRETMAPIGEPETGETRQGAGPGTALTASLQAIASSHLNQCIRSNADAPSNLNLRVSVEIRLERNGRLSAQPRLVDQARIMNSSNSYLRVAGERALRGVIECQPYPLPPEHYQQWRVLVVNVDTQ